MIYTTPALLRVGAAQNLVRDASPVGSNKIIGVTNPFCHLPFEDHLAVGDEYQFDGTW